MYKVSQQSVNDRSFHSQRTRTRTRTQYSVLDSLLKRTITTYSY